MSTPNSELQPQTSAVTSEISEFSNLLKKEFKPRGEKATQAVEKAVQTLAEQALTGIELRSADTQAKIQEMIAALDTMLSEQVREVLHHPEFQSLESAWRGLHYLVSNTETDETLKIRVMNISKNEMRKTLNKFDGTAWDQSPIFKKLYEEEYGQFGGQPYGTLVADYYFDNSGPDVKLLSQMAKISAAAHAPLITAADPGVMLMESWEELANPSNLTKLLQTPQHAEWRDFRESEDARYVGLAMPRFLSRAPYGARTNPVEEFNFEEFPFSADGKAAPQIDNKKFTWANAAYAMAVNINRSFKNYGWCSQIRGIESGGDVENLPVYTFPTDDGGVDMTCPTEIAISDRREAELAKNGFMPLVHKKNSNFAAFIGAQSLHKPAEYDDPDATANANLGARLPYLFATCRFAHYLKCIVRDKIGSFKERADMEIWLNNWVGRYVEHNPAVATEADKARKPLAGAEVYVEEVEGNPGYYAAKFFLRPHYQLEGLTVAMRLVSKLPSAKA